jgi:WD40 repeat protein
VGNIKVWDISFIESHLGGPFLKDAPNLKGKRVHLKLEQSHTILLSSSPEKFFMNADCSCIAVALKDFKVQLLKNIHGKYGFCQLITVQVHGHLDDDDHLLNITELSVLPKLKIFATSSEDGTVKIWNLEKNALIRYSS